MTKFAVPALAQDKVLYVGIVVSLVLRAVFIFAGAAAIPLAKDYDDSKLSTRVDGRRMLTPMVIVIAAIGMANVVFALDSIPAIFGLTTDAYVIFTANALALMGLRQLYFLIGGLLERIIYLKVGLAVILGFIGVKLLIEALHGSHIDDIGSFHLPEIGTITSLLFIVATLTVTTVVSLIKTGMDRRTGGDGTAA